MELGMAASLCSNKEGMKDPIENRFLLDVPRFRCCGV